MRAPIVLDTEEAISRILYLSQTSERGGIHLSIGI